MRLQHSLFSSQALFQKIQLVSNNNNIFVDKLCEKYDYDDVIYLYTYLSLYFLTVLTNLFVLLNTILS